MHEYERRGGGEGARDASCIAYLRRDPRTGGSGDARRSRGGEEVEEEEEGAIGAPLSSLAISTPARGGVPAHWFDKSRKKPGPPAPTGTGSLASRCANQRCRT